MDVALEALRDAVDSRGATVDELARVAGVCRVQTVISPFLEMFILKRAMLFALWGGSMYRATRDLDLTGYTDEDSRALIAIMQEICAVPCLGDGLGNAIEPSAQEQECPVALGPAFYSDAKRAAERRRYLSRNDLPGAPADFDSVGELLLALLGPIWSALSDGRTFSATWPPSGP